MIWNNFKLDALKNLPLYVLLADKLRQKIARGELAPGEKLPSSRELQKLLHLSAITIERGLNVLVDEGFLYRRPRCGTFVAAILPRGGVKIDPPQSVYAIFTNMSIVSAYWYMVLDALEKECRKTGYHLNFLQLGHTRGELDLPTYSNCAGVLLCGYNSRAFAGELQRRGIPVVLIGSLDTRGESEEDFDMVVHNDSERARLSTCHLLDLGHRRIVCVTGPSRSKYSAKQRRGFLEAMREYALEVEAGDLFEVEEPEYRYGRQVGYEILCRRARPSAIYAGSDRVALGIIETAKQLGLQVPEDFSIIGCGGYMFGGVPIRPGLTTTLSKPRECARAAMRKLRRRIKGEACSGKAVIRVDSIQFGETTMGYKNSYDDSNRNEAVRMLPRAK